MHTRREGVELSVNCLVGASRFGGSQPVTGGNSQIENSNTTGKRNSKVHKQVHVPMETKVRTSASKYRQLKYQISLENQVPRIGKFSVTAWRIQALALLNKKDARFGC